MPAVTKAFARITIEVVGYQQFVVNGVKFRVTVNGVKEGRVAIIPVGNAVDQLSSRKRAGNIGCRAVAT